MWLQSSSQFFTIFRHLFIYRQYVWQNMTSEALPRFHPYKTQCFPSGTSSVVSCFSNFSDSTYFFHLTGARMQVKETAASSYSRNLIYSQVKPQQGWIEYALKGSSCGLDLWKHAMSSSPDQHEENRGNWNRPWCWPCQGFSYERAGEEFGEKWMIMKLSMINDWSWYYCFKVRTLVKLWPSGCNLKALRATDLSESGRVSTGVI